MWRNDIRKIAPGTGNGGRVSYWASMNSRCAKLGPHMDCRMINIQPALQIPCYLQGGVLRKASQPAWSEAECGISRTIDRRPDGAARGAADFASLHPGYQSQTYGRLIFS